MWETCSMTSHLKKAPGRTGERPGLHYPLPAPTPPGNMRWPVDHKTFISKLQMYLLSEKRHSPGDEASASSSLFPNCTAVQIQSP